MINKILKFLGYVSIKELDERHRVFLKKHKEKLRTAQDQETRIKEAHWMEAGVDIWSDIVLDTEFKEKQK